MALGNFMFFFLTALVAVNLIFAQEEEEFDQQRFEHSANDSENSERRSNNRLTTCNYAETPEPTCRGCFTVLRCLSSNVGILRPCRGFLSYCNSGRCSFIPPTNCSSSG